MGRNKVSIRKYENRRLYDCSHSRYVNLDEIAHMVREGADVEVRDARSGEDLTRMVLTQIIMEDARNRDTGLPVDLLHQLVAASGCAGHEDLVRCLRNVFDSYREARESFQARLPHPRSFAFAPFDYIQSLFSREHDAKGPPAGAPGAAPQANGSGDAAPDEESVRLRKRIEDLERRLTEAQQEKVRRGARHKGKSTRPHVGPAQP